MTLLRLLSNMRAFIPLIKPFLTNLPLGTCVIFSFDVQFYCVNSSGRLLVDTS